MNVLVCMRVRAPARVYFTIHEKHFLNLIEYFCIYSLVTVR